MASCAASTFALTSARVRGSPAARGELLGEEGARIGDQTFGYFIRRFTIGTRSLFLHPPFGLGRRPRHCRRIGSGRWPARLISLSHFAMMSFASGSPNSDFTSASAVRSFFSISRECGLSAKRISDASISSCLFLACRANLFEAF